ncbi:hypothetical protein [Roseateles sp. LKC17W]|uniref:PEP-CTERM sorting domain-containing protein n=1 Tax=Pelomonas margarita TaxID=3299031 RepID=A0ABW7FN23_9BURK
MPFLSRPQLGLITALLLAGVAAQAAPVPAGLSITGQVSFDLPNSTTPTGGAAQTGQLSLLSGGGSTSSSFNGSPAGGPLSGAFTATGDGIGAALSGSGSMSSPTAPDMTAGFVFVDYRIDLINTSATQTFTILFQAAYGQGNLAQASGDDAFAASSLSVYDAVYTELIYTDFFTDTLNPGNNKALASVADTFSITLAPGQSGYFTALQTMRGGVFEPGNFNAGLDAFLSLQRIDASGDDPGRLPLPASLPLALTALGLLGLVRKVRS